MNTFLIVMALCSIAGMLLSIVCMLSRIARALERIADQM